MMDMFFESSNDMMSLNDLEGDLKYSMEFGMELMKESSILGGDWNDWNETTQPSLSLDLLATVDTSLMVNPKSVIPVKPYSHYNVQLDESLKVGRPRLHDDLQSPAIKEEEESEESEEEEEEEQEEEEEEGEDESGEEEEEEESDSEDDEEEVKTQDWSNNEKENKFIPQAVRVRPVSSLMERHISGGKPLAMMKAKKAQLKMQPTYIKVNQMESLIREHAQSQKAKKMAQLARQGRFIEDYPKPAYSYSCLIAMALKNSRTGSLPVSEIYNFMCEHFPYFVYAPSGWKNSVRHNLSLNKCFEKIEKGNPGGGGCRKGCLWAMNPAKITKMDDEVAKWSRKDPNGIRRSMRYPDELEKLEKGDLKSISAIKTEYASDEEELVEEIEEEVEEEDEESEEDTRVVQDNDTDSEDEEKVPPSLKRFDAKLNADALELDISEEMYEELDLLQNVVKEEEIYQAAKRQRFSPSLHRQPLKLV